MKNTSILIVEDEQIVAMDIRNTLENYDFHVAGQTDRGEEAVLQAGELRPDLILMDINLRGTLDGIEAAIQIRAQFDVPVIFLTAYGNPTILERARLAEPFAYIFKPFEERELVSNIEMALHKHMMEQKVRASEDKFRSVIQHSSDGIVLADDQGNVIEWNQAAEQITGLGRSNVIGQPLWDVIFCMLPQEQRSPSVQEALKASWKVVVENRYASGLDQLTEMEIETPQGIRRIGQSNGFSIETAQGVLGGAIIRDITEMKKAQDSVFNSERRFRALIEHGRDNISLLSTDGSLIWESPSVIHTLGYEHDQFLGSNIFDLMHPDDLEWTREVFGRVIQKHGNSEDGIFRLRRNDGSWRWIEATATNLLNDPSVDAIIINYRDITERKQSEEKIMQFLHVLEASLNEIYIFDSQTLKFEYVNEGARNNLGYSMEQLLDLMVYDIKPEFSEAAFRKIVEPLLLHEKDKLVFQTSHRRADGSLYPVEVHLQLVERENRALFLAFINDITERKQAEFELRKLSQAVDQSANAIVITDIEGNIEYANPKFMEVSGYSLSEVIGKTPRILRSGEHGLELYRNLWQTIKAGRVWKGEVHNRRKDGTLYWEDSTITPVFDSEHKLVNFIAIKEDITTRKELEEAERDQRKLAEALRDTSTALNGTLNLDEVLDRVLENIEKVAPFDAAMVLMIKGHAVRKIRQSNNLEKTIHSGVTGNTQANLINVPILQEMRETRQPCLIPDTQRDPRWRTVPGMGWIRSFISVPVIIRGQVVGILNVLSGTPSFFTQAHAERLVAFASQVAVAMENAQLFERVHHLSVTDSLTELMNRRHFFEVAKIELERTHRYHRTLSVMMIDIDHFKTINDTHGHATGDVALREVAGRIKHSVRAVDVVARYGGEEFIVLMPETTIQEACQVAERVRRSVSDDPIDDNSVEVWTTLSIGVAEMDGQNSDIDKIIRYADQALYAAKAAGRNRVESYRNP